MFFSVKANFWQLIGIAFLLNSCSSQDENNSQESEDVSNDIQDGEDVNNDIQDGEDVNNDIQDNEDVNNDIQDDEDVSNDIQDDEDVSNDIQDDDVNNGLAELLINPYEITFPSTNLGESSQQYLSIQNVGTSLLTITDMEISNPMFSIGVEINFPIELENGPEQTFPVVFTPTTEEEVTGQLTIHSNSSNGEEVVILRSMFLGEMLQIDPDPIHFGSVASNETSSIIVTIGNSRNAEIEVNNMFVAGSSDFRITEISTNLPFVLQSNEDMTITLTYAPLDDNFNAASLMISHRQANSSTSFQNRMVEINGNGTN